MSRYDDPESADAVPIAAPVLTGATPSRRPGPSWPTSGPHGGASGSAAGAARPSPWRCSLAAIGFLAFQGLTSPRPSTSRRRRRRSPTGPRSAPSPSGSRARSKTVRSRGGDVLFTIYGPGQAVNVVSSGSPPELFKPGIPVVLDGHWQGDTYMSNLIMVKHTASYTEAHPDRLKPQVRLERRLQERQVTAPR